MTHRFAFDRPLESCDVFDNAAGCRALEMFIHSASGRPDTPRAKLPIGRIQAQAEVSPEGYRDLSDHDGGPQR